MIASARAWSQMPILYLYKEPTRRVFAMRLTFQISGALLVGSADGAAEGVGEGGEFQIATRRSDWASLGCDQVGLGDAHGALIACVRKRSGGRCGTCIETRRNRAQYFYKL